MPTSIRSYCVWAVMVCLILAGSAPAVVPTTAGKGPVIVPIEVLPSGHIAIHARINGKGPYRFIFDTGAPSLVISERVGRDAGILPGDFKRPLFTVMGNLGIHPVESISLGNARQEHLPADIWNHPTVEILGRTYGPFEGLIGFPFFAHYQVTIDYKSSTMTLVPCVYQPEDTEEKMARRMSGGPQPPVVLGSNESLGVRVGKETTDSAAGVLIKSVMAHSPAETAGLKPGDRLLSLDGRWTDTLDDCLRAMMSVNTDRPVTIEYQRGTERHTATATVRAGI